VKIHYIQHVPFEDLGVIQTWAEEKGASISVTQVFQKAVFPSCEEFDWLFVMGGPMNIYEDTIYPWLCKEKEFIRSAIDNGKQVIGICLGAQLIADACGGRVYKNAHTEIGWFPVKVNQSEKHPAWIQGMPSEFQAFHWHGDTFDVPQEATLFLTSAACTNQGFYIDSGRIIAMQCHFELTPAGAQNLIAHCYKNESSEPYVQGKDEMLGKENYFQEAHKRLFSILDEHAAF